MQNNSALRLINSAAAADAAAAGVLGTTKPARRILSPAAQAARQQFVWLNQQWGSAEITDFTRQAYVELGRSYSVGSGNSSQGKSVWVSLNTLRLQAGMGLLLSPPRYREGAGTVPTYTVSAVVTTGGVLTLHVTPSEDFSTNITLVSATKPLTGGTTKPQPKDYQVLETAETLTTAGLDLSASWLRVYGRPPDVGTRIGVCLLPVSPLGFPGVEVCRDVLVEAP